MWIKKHVFLFAAMLCGVLVCFTAGFVGFTLNNCSPLKIIEGDMKIRLPDSATVEQFTTYQDNGYDHFYAKVSFDAADTDELKKEIAGNYSDGGDAAPESVEGAAWWNLKTDALLASYKRFTSGEVHIFGATLLTRESNVYICEGTNGRRYLYACY